MLICHSAYGKQLNTLVEPRIIFATTKFTKEQDAPLEVQLVTTNNARAQATRFLQKTVLINANATPVNLLLSD
jgi:hypothetical protein